MCQIVVLRTFRGGELFLKEDDDFYALLIDVLQSLYDLTIYYRLSIFIECLFERGIVGEDVTKRRGREFWIDGEQLSNDSGEMSGSKAAPGA